MFEFALLKLMCVVYIWAWMVYLTVCGFYSACQLFQRSDKQLSQSSETSSQALKLKFSNSTQNEALQQQNERAITLKTNCQTASDSMNVVSVRYGKIKMTQ